jgi:hypothetical protein
MAKELRPIRRIVCDINAAGKSVIGSDGPPPAVRPSMRPGFQSRNIWATFGSPAPLSDPDRSKEVAGLMPPKGGTVFKYLDIPPDAPDAMARNSTYRAHELQRAASTGESGLRRHPDSPRHPGMHETDTIDYAIVLSGEIWAIMDEGETLMRTGDILIQNGTNHAWANRSKESCRVLFILVDGRQ